MDINEYISSGILELYVLGDLSEEEMRVVEQMAITYPAVQAEILLINNVFEKYAFENAVIPCVTVKPFVMAMVDFMERMENGEQPSFPPELNEQSKVIDFATWLDRSDMQYFFDEGNVYAKIIGYTPKVTTAIAWIKGEAITETHSNEYEKFLIVEGTCNIIIDDNVNQLVPGNYFSIPLHKKHQVIVTSAIPCKIILQRIAA